MGRILYIHVGPPKTGTSAAQAVLREHDGTAVLYPHVGLWPDGSHHNLVFNFYRDYARKAVVREDTDALFARIAAQAEASDRNVVISSEVLAGRADIEQFVSALLSCLGPAFRAEFLYVVRDHLERAASAYNQRAKDAFVSENRDPDIFLVEHAARVICAPTLRRLQQTGRPITVFSYHPAREVVPKLLAYLGLSEEEIASAGVRNLSLNMKALVATVAANRVVRTREGRNRIKAALLNMPGAFAPSVRIFSAQAIADAERFFAPDREFLRDAFGLDLPAPDPSRAGEFRIDPGEFAEIDAALAGLGPDGEAVRARVLQYVPPGV